MGVGEWVACFVLANWIWRGVGETGGVLLILKVKKSLREVLVGSYGL